MKPIIWILLSILIAGSCKSPSYNYYSPTLNAAPYAQQGEAHLGFNVGTVGIAAKAGIAITDQFNINGFFGGIPSSESDYQGREGEVSLGYQTHPSNDRVFGITAGIGLGRNSNESKNFSGDIKRPFFQFQYGSFDKAFLSKNIYYDGYIGARVNYLTYNGAKEYQEFDHQHFLYEPFFGAAIGGKNVRFELIQGFAFKNAREWSKGLRVFPYFASLGMLVKVGGGR